MRLALFHGTNQAFDRFDPAMLGLNTSNAASRAAFFFASDFEAARDYALFAARNLVPDQDAHEARVERLLRDADRAMRRGDNDRYERLILEAEALETRAMQADPAGARVLTCTVTLENPVEFDGSAREVVCDLGAVLTAARAAGHDGVILRGIHDTPTGQGPACDHVAVFDPARIEILEVLEIAEEAETEPAI
ncbi:hypothetical protein [Defluviimonas salinarum]|uniref:Uncharacterized protein n=1 Tax=Defluviimonas salinarum TaxID=2992147 RepID=A0ABT3J9V5_9RHOB|nr:hypothetical protein [Defluviimonas salinarum]MCW3784179.1 hypothetical protein [Defluviimonas salinarum]